MTAFTRHLIVLLLACLLGSCSTDPSSDPNRFSLAQGEVAHLRAPQRLTLRNAYTAPAVKQVQAGLIPLEFDQKQFTDTAIAVLSRAMEKHGIQVAPQGEKTVTLRVRGPTNLRMRGGLGATSRTVRLELDAEFGDGTRTSLEAEETTGGEFTRAMDGAVLVALKDLVADEKFLAYMQR